MVGKGRNSITFKDVSSKVSDAALVWFYLGVRQIPCFIQSPLRRDDRPSFGLYSLDGKRIFFTDLATKEKGGIYDLLAKMWHCSYNEVLSRIQRDFLKNNGEANVNLMAAPKTVSEITSHSEVSMEVKVREWRQYDIDYWTSYGVPLEWLKYAEVYPISHKIITKNGIKSIFGADRLAYAFVEHKEGKITLKIYQPLNKEGYKWANTHDRSVVSLWTKIPETGDKVVICSSLKDALCFWANTGIPALALQGEGYGMSDTAIAELKRRYKQVYILFDNDKAGIKDSKKLSEQTGFTNLILPAFEGGKDVSDLMKCKGKEAFITIINNLFNPSMTTPDDPNCPF
jgi:hypothetical protein